MKLPPRSGLPVRRLALTPGRTLALSRRELYSAFNSPAFYALAIFFPLFVSVWFFYLQRFFSMDTATLRPFFAAFPLAFIFVIPLLSMKSWAEEKKMGSAELLFTLPFSEWELVLGKFLAGLAQVCLFMALTLPVPLTLLPLGYFDPGVILGEYLGALLLAASALSLGLFCSSLSRNQSGAFLGAASALIAVMLVNNLNASLNLPEVLAAAINYVSLSFHFESFSRGLVDSRDAAFFILTTLLFLYANVQVLLLRKWR